jgi:hypothetical protein
VDLRPGGEYLSVTMRPRYWLPLVGALACLVAAQLVGAIAAWLLIILAFGLVLDAGTAAWARAGGTGSLYDHKQ